MRSRVASIEPSASSCPIRCSSATAGTTRWRTGAGPRRSIGRLTQEEREERHQALAVFYEGKLPIAVVHHLLAGGLLERGLDRVAELLKVSPDASGLRVGSEITASEVAATIESALSAAETLEAPGARDQRPPAMPGVAQRPRRGRLLLARRARLARAAQARLGPALLARDRRRRPGSTAATRARSGRAEVRGDAGARPRVSAGRSGPGVVPLRGDLDRDRLEVPELRAPRDVARACSSRSRPCRPSSR